MTDESAIELLIDDFFRAFDARDWVGMRITIAAELKIDFTTPRGGRPMLLEVNPDSFVRHRANSITSVDMHHDFDLMTLWIDEDVAEASGRFAIKRFSEDGERHFHSWGEYEFTFVREYRRGWRIRSIAQMAWRSEGDAKLHVAPRVAPPDRQIA
jgi:SnoaL-like domain